MQERHDGQWKGCAKRKEYHSIVLFLPIWTQVRAVGVRFGNIICRDDRPSGPVHLMP